MRLQGALHSLLRDVGSDVKVFELGVAAVQVDDQRVLLDDALLLLLLRLPGLVALLHLFDDAEGVLQVGGGDRCVAGGLQVGRPIRAGQRRRSVPKSAAAEAEEKPTSAPPMEHSHFLDKGGVWVGEDVSFLSTQIAARDVEVDPQVGVVSFY